MLGSATFTTLASRTTMNWATATTASTAVALARTASLGRASTGSCGLCCTGCTIAPTQVRRPRRMPVIFRLRALFDAIQGGEIAVIELERGRRHVLLEVRDRAR